jgi:hypothetical protein
MANVIQIEQNDTIRELMEIAASFRSGEYVGVTVVVTKNCGKVEMKTLSIPAPGVVKVAA